MDGPLEDPEELYRNLKELVFINRFTANYSATFKKMSNLIPAYKRELRVVDIGCGAGDWLNYLHQKSSKLPPQSQFTGLDFEPHAIEFAKTRFPKLKSSVNWRVGSLEDYISAGEPVDIACCNLLCHHLDEGEIVGMLRGLGRICKLGIMINDLERNWLAYESIRILTGLFSSSRYTRHDAPLSVKRGFKKAEWKGLLHRAFPEGNVDFSISNMWAFRHLIIIRTDDV